jgi:N-acetylmuramoyl-L-alanine amidase
MSYKHLVISSGHGSLVRGASGILDEVDEARKVVEAVAEKPRNRGAEAVTFTMTLTRI